MKMSYFFLYFSKTECFKVYFIGLVIGQPCEPKVGIVKPEVVEEKHGGGEEKDRLGPLLGSNQSLASQDSRHSRLREYMPPIPRIFPLPSIGRMWDLFSRIPRRSSLCSHFIVVLILYFYHIVDFQFLHKYCCRNSKIKKCQAFLLNSNRWEKINLMGWWREVIRGH